VTSKLRELSDIAGLITDGMTIGIGGWGSRRKPLALIGEVVRSKAKNLTIVSFGGPDVGILCRTGQARTIMHAFVSLDTISIEPHFAAARQAGSVVNEEFDEAMLVSGLRAAGRRLPFEVTRAGLGSDAITKNPRLHLITSPYDDGEQLLAMPAIPLDLALLHLNRADERGNAQCLGPDPYFDDLFARAAQTTVVSVEQVVPTVELTAHESLRTLLLNRTMVDHIVQTPGGAGFTSCEPDYGRDEAAQLRYADSANSDAAWEAIVSHIGSRSKHEK
jgi:glutaconate CoA-transferase subunit A